MNDELLIHLVRKHPVLYDLSNPKYMDNHLRNNIWKIIGQEMSLNASTCKARWNNIRDNYRKYLKKNETKPSLNSKKKFYKYHELLGFLKPYFYYREKKEVDNIEDIERKEHSDLTLIRNSFSSSPVLTLTPLPVLVGMEHPPHSPEILSSPPLSPSISTSPNSESSFSPTQKKSKIRESTRDIFQNTNTASIMEYLIKKDKNTTQQEPVDAFLAGIAPTLKSLNPYYLNLAKTEIFAAVQKYELEMIKNPHQYLNKEHTQEIPTTSFNPGAITVFKSENNFNNVDNTDT